MYRQGLKLEEIENFLVSKAASTMDDIQQVASCFTTGCNSRAISRTFGTVLGLIGVLKSLSIHHKLVQPCRLHF